MRRSTARPLLVGTGDDPVTRPCPGESTADPRVQAGYATPGIHNVVRAKLRSLADEQPNVAEPARAIQGSKGDGR